METERKEEEKNEILMLISSYLPRLGYYTYTYILGKKYISVVVGQNILKSKYVPKTIDLIFKDLTYFFVYSLSIHG